MPAALPAQSPSSLQASFPRKPCLILPIEMWSPPVCNLTERNEKAAGHSHFTYKPSMCLGSWGHLPFCRPWGNIYKFTGKTKLFIISGKEKPGRHWRLGGGSGSRWSDVPLHVLKLSGPSQLVFPNRGCSPYLSDVTAVAKSLQSPSQKPESHPWLSLLSPTASESPYLVMPPSSSTSSSPALLRATSSPIRMTAMAFWSVFLPAASPHIHPSPSTLQPARQVYFANLIKASQLLHN